METNKLKIIKITKPNNWYRHSSYVGQTFNVDREQLYRYADKWIYMYQYRVLFQDLDGMYKYGWVDACDCEVIIPNNEPKECDHVHSSITLYNDVHNEIEWCKKCGAHKRTFKFCKDKDVWVKPNPKRNIEDILNDFKSSCKTCVMFPTCEGCKCVKNTIKEIEALNGK